MKKLILMWMPILAWAAVIFMLSSQPYEKQSLRPFLTDTVNIDWVRWQLSNLSFIYAGKVISIDTVSVVGFLEFIIRKGAHFFVFFILGWLLYRGLNSIFQSRQLLSFMVSLFLVAFYAASDEYHQIFTANRTPLVNDVFLDFFGGFIGICFASLVYKRTIEARNSVPLPSK